MHKRRGAVAAGFPFACEHVLPYGALFSRADADGGFCLFQVDRFTKDPFGLGLEILKEQADAGAPVNINEVCRTLLPPGLLQPLLVVAGLQRDAAEKARDLLSKAQQRVPRMPWQRDESWLDGKSPRFPSCVCCGWMASLTHGKYNYGVGTLLQDDSFALIAFPRQVFEENCRRCRHGFPGQKHSSCRGGREILAREIGKRQVQDTGRQRRACGDTNPPLEKLS